jgi:hypothetical protein
MLEGTHFLLSPSFVQPPSTLKGEFLWEQTYTLKKSIIP